MRVKLLKFEQTAMMTENSISKITFFPDVVDQDVSAIVRNRMLEMLRLNPWLAWVPRSALLRCVHEKGGALISDLRPGY
jgi:hypothetical protein